MQVFQRFATAAGKRVKLMVTFMMLGVLAVIGFLCVAGSLTPGKRR